LRGKVNFRPICFLGKVELAITQFKIVGETLTENQMKLSKYCNIASLLYKRKDILKKGYDFITEVFFSDSQTSVYCKQTKGHLKLNLIRFCH